MNADERRLRAERDSLAIQKMCLDSAIRHTDRAVLELRWAVKAIKVRDSERQAYERKALANIRLGVAQHNLGISHPC